MVGPPDGYRAIDMTAYGRAIREKNHCGVVRNHVFHLVHGHQPLQPGDRR